MAPVTQCFESQDLINVSQDAHTSPTSVVGDSLDITKKGGPVQHTTQDQTDHDQNHDEDEDELYDVTPPRRAAFDTVEGSTKTAAKSASDFAAKPARPRASIADPSRNGEVAHVAGGAINELAENGTRAQRTHDGKQRLVDRAFQEGDGAKEQDDQGKSSINSTSKSVQGATSRKPKANPQDSAPASVTMKTKATPASSNSALAALQARKDAGTKANETGTTAKLTSKNQSNREVAGQPTQASRKALVETNKNAWSATPMNASSQQPLESKPKSRKLGMFAETTTRNMETAMTDTADTVERPKQACPGADAKRKGQSKQTGTIPSRATGTAATTSRTVKSQLATTAPSLEDFYDIPTEEPSEQAGKGKGKSEPKPKQSGRQHRAAENRSNHVPEKKSRGRAKKRSGAEDSDEYVDAPTRTQPTKLAKTSVVPTRRKAVPKTAAPSSSSSEEGAEIRRDAEHHQESIEAFEQAVTHLDENGNSHKTDTFEQSAHDVADATADELVNSDPPQAKKKALGTDAKTGASQDNAILLSDRQEPSSELEEAEPAPAKPKPRSRPAAQAAIAPHTPAAPPSSPPNYVPDEPQNPLTELDAPHRSTIIGFDRSGPRNQGTRSAKNPTAGTPWHARTSAGPPSGKPAEQRHSAFARLEARRGLGPSSTAGSMRSHRTHPTDRTAKPDNVAADVTDALSGLLGRGKQLDAEEGLELRTKAEIAAWGEHDPDEGFQLIDDANPLPSTSVETNEVPRQGPVLTQPQLLRTASQVAMPPPAPKHSDFITEDVSATVPLPKVLVATKEVSTRVQSAIQSAKRASADDDLQAPAPKKHKSKQPVSSTAPNTTDDPPAKSNQTRKTIQATGKSRASRKASQGNVDIGGSPIPKDMIVPDNATALKIFSQQAGLSSDPDSVNAKPATSMFMTSAMRVEDPSFFDHLISVPSGQPQQLASNDKRKPASPGQESAAITGVAIRRLDGRRLVIQDESDHPPTDPFTSSGAHEHVRKGSSSSQLAEKLRQNVAPYFQKRKSDAHAEDPDKTLVEEGPQSKKPKVANPANVIQARAAATAEEDPDRTLVEDEPQAKKRRPMKVAKAVLEEVTDAAEENEEMSDIGFWRNGLQNYQVNMFDTLVSISHKLMRRFVDHETAMREAVSDYRKEGLNMIEEMERRRAAVYKASLKRLEERKERMRGDLTAASVKLRDAVIVMGQKRAERSEIGRKLDVEEARLTGILAGMC